ncbi:short chain dehydrogenase [Roseovarius sp. 2305UL8-3]|uniref:short chain dehydrogenase n=1 Tax=Roseovarius conchicola TaxID=3121636 RepID=UPI003527E3A4
MQKMLVIGGTGAIGRLVIAEMGQGYDVVTAARSGGDHRVDIADLASIRSLLTAVGKIDVLISAAGGVAFERIDRMRDADIERSLAAKLLGQVNLVRQAVAHMSDEGSIVLTSGCTNVQAVQRGAISGLINGGLAGFVTCAASDMPRGIRINAVSPGYLRETSGDGSGCPGFALVEGVDVARAYHRCVAQRLTGQVIAVH